MDEDAVRDLLREVEDPDLGDDIVSLNLVNGIELDGESVHVSLALGAPYSPVETAIADEVRQVLGNAGLEVELSAHVDEGISADEQVFPGVENVIAVASGKGGVGKSTVAVNLAAGLADMGARVGLFDADIYGPNIPRMVDADEPPQATEDETLVPPEKYGMKLMSMAFLVGEDDPVIWRGPMVHKVLTQLWEDVEWGQLDYMVIDLPPGTGDTQLTLLQTVPVTGAVIVTTPQDVALDDARKGLEMFGKHDTPVLGIAENMATFKCPDCGGEHDIFGADGGKRFADVHDMPLLGSIPLDPAVRSGGDAGKPIVLDQDSDTGEAFRHIAREASNNAGIVRRRTQQ
ncbi:Mrp/NBP35 family ATP-binding protein [Natranaeroarchaeum sulfidigenes]|uniref:Iron-sulfur cluster carrier protein n=1 Tax=Natranaeroarchaeum sulfidigenes TaxID=2784880 RepID=A0A897MKR2_9EURY|nr:Mrp/NBP35 family ATP-binding protein [Natranaeroarchaeum sulfidigenes]QSG02720.1 Mrp family protein, ATPase, contains iron-sulfurcluster [Natranaeroarchaeum sulfidigenes]